MEHKATLEELASKFPQPHPVVGEVQAELLKVREDLFRAEQRLVTLRNQEAELRKKLGRFWSEFHERFERHIQEVIDGQDPDGRIPSDLV